MILRCGPQEQRLAVADLTADGAGVLDGLRDGRPVAVVYSDPPWSPGNEKWWRRRAGAAPPVAYTALLDGWCRAVAACRPEHVFCEQSIHAGHRQQLLDAVARCPGWTLPLLEQWEVRYGSPKRPNVLLHFGREALRTDPSGMSGEPMTRRVLEGLALPAGAVAADPCTGLGMTSRMAHEFGLSFIGTELDPARLARTRGWLEKRGYRESPAATVTAPPVVPCPAPPVSRPGLAEAIRALAALPEAERVAAYNEAQCALGALVADLAPDPACAPQLVPADAVQANDYNPNRVASTELDLLEQSMRADGITMPVVVMPAAGRWLVIDGFHRHGVATQRLGRRWLVCSTIDRPLADRMASTVRHNRARGKHQVELMAALVKGMMDLGWDDERVAEALGMSVEELLRLRQMVGAARLLAAETYSRSWGSIAGAVEQEPGDEPEAGPA